MIKIEDSTEYSPDTPRFGNAMHGISVGLKSAFADERFRGLSKDPYRSAPKVPGNPLDWHWSIPSEDRETKEVLAWQTGLRGKKTLKKLLVQISHVSCDYYATDKWKVYRQLIHENKLIQSKAETHIIESQNCRVRHYLARFKRKTPCYSKSVAMVNLTLLLFFRAPPYSLSIF